MAVNGYMFIDNVQGSSRKRPGAIDIVSFRFDIGGDLVQELEGGMHIGNIHYGNMIVERHVDMASIFLLKPLIDGNFNWGNIEIIYDKPVGDIQEEFFKIQLLNCLIPKVEYSGLQEVPKESITIVYEVARMSYNAETDEGGLKGWVTT